MPLPPALPYELRIGVTGHRNLPDPEGVKQAVERLLDHIQRTLQSASEFPWGEQGSPRTIAQRLIHIASRPAKLVWPSLPTPQVHTPLDQRTPLRWTVISPIARGADRIVARAVLNRPNSQLQVVTPFPLDDYRRDFKDQADRDEFENLLREDKAPTELRGSYAGNTSQRNAGYLRVGHRVVDSCEIVVAIWNGEPANATGGTGDIVEYAIDQGRVVLWINSEKPAEPARMLVKRADNAGLPATEAGIAHRPLADRAKQLSANFHALAAYNQDPAFDQSEHRAIQERNAAELKRIAADSGLGANDVAAWLDHFLPHYARADQLALRYQSLYVQAAVGLYLTSAVAVTLATIQVLFFPHALWIISFEILAMALVLLVWRLSKTGGWHEKWLHDRHLAERIRISMFTALFPVRSTVTQPHAELPFYPGPEGWMIDVVDRLTQSAPLTGTGLLPFDSPKQFILQAWIYQQANWHEKNARRKHGAAKWSHRFGLFLFAATLLMAILHLLGVGHREPGHDEFTFAWLSLLIATLAIVLPAFGSAVHAINTLRDRERIAARSKRMHEILTAIGKRAEQATSVDELRQEVLHAAKVMAAENHEWWVSLSYRDLVLPS